VVAWIIYRKIAIFLIFISFFYLLKNSFAETIELKSGQKIEGEITFETSEYIIIRRGDEKPLKIEKQKIYLIIHSETKDAISANSISAKGAIIYPLGDFRNLLPVLFGFFISYEHAFDLWLPIIRAQTGFLYSKHNSFSMYGSLNFVGPVWELPLKSLGKISMGPMLGFTYLQLKGRSNLITQFTLAWAGSLGYQLVLKIVDILLRFNYIQIYDPNIPLNSLALELGVRYKL